MRAEFLPTEMSPAHLSRDLSLLRQGISIGAEFGPHALVMLARIAEIVEDSVYAPQSLWATPQGIRFVLQNPPLRVGAFGSIQARVNGVEAPPERARFRTAGQEGFRSFRDVSRDLPLTMIPGQRTEVELDLAAPLPKGPVTIHLSVRSIAIPPLVWFEFTDTIHAPEESP
ncbi:MAG: hypothetical protein WAN87_10000 [Thermoplasmata archaeon]